LESYKGHQRVLAALPHLVDDMPDVRLRVVGSGPYESELRRLAQELNIQDRVEIGPIPPTDRVAMATLMSTAGLVTLLSEYEAHPVAVTEALALGRRVLVADTSGLSEFARRGQAMAIPLDSSPAEVASAIRAALRRPPPEAVAIPTWDDCAARLAQTYRSVLATQ
jgi:glycosyltransferase involved in cell wall biosynthesis